MFVIMAVKTMYKSGTPAGCILYSYCTAYGRKLYEYIRKACQY
jgi:hypothetical protein